MDFDVVVVGGANIDIVGKSDSQIIMEESNLGDIYYNFGGVGRNIAENLARIGIKVKFITALGRDDDGKKIFEHLKSLNINTRDIVISKEYATSKYLYILDSNGEMVTAINSMKIVSLIDDKKITNMCETVRSSEYLLLDGNIKESVIGSIFENCTDTKIIFDPVSITKSKKIVPYLDKLYALKANKFELEHLSGVKITDDESVIKAGKKLIRKGTKKVFITLGEKGALYMDKDEYFFRQNMDANVVNVTGAGDAFSAGFIYGLIKGHNSQKTMDFGLAAASITVESEKTCSEKLNERTIIERINNV